MQQHLKRLHFGRQIRAGRFVTSEPEYSRLGEWVTPGDWVLDVGANVGHYALRLAQLVGPSGRVLAFEPVPETFELLASDVAAAGAHNVSLFNVAASTRFGAAGIALPHFATGLTNYYMACLTESGGAFEVLTMPLDAMMPPKPISLVKIDVEGHELPALTGMQGILRRDHPRLIVEGTSNDVAGFLAQLGYRFFELNGSPNRVFE
ncbi:methyltransferase FkbM family, partial [mine drainage metagenome]